MDKNEARKYFDALDENSDWRSTDGVVTIPKHLFMNLLDALGAAAEHDDEPAPQAAPQQPVPVDAEVWKRVKSQVKFLTWKLNPFGHRRDIYDAHHCLGWLMCAVEDNETAAVVINRLERIVERLDDSVRCAISATEGFDLSEDA